MQHYFILISVIVVKKYTEAFVRGSSSSRSSNALGMIGSKTLTLTSSNSRSSMPGMPRIGSMSTWLHIHSTNNESDGNDVEKDHAAEDLNQKKAESYFSAVDYADTDPNTSWVTAKRNKPPKEELIKFESEEWRRWRMIRYYEIMTLTSAAFCVLNPFVLIRGHDKYYTVVHIPVEMVIMVCGEVLALLLSRILRDAVS